MTSLIEVKQIIDQEWADLIQEALDAGISAEEIRAFFLENKEKKIYYNS
ncbi:anti-repressor SinI family protein [Metabacillus fastidiosus]|uniref:Anti-repressor SinI family protein n=1 Tax=Metabacillus fastidiosus TaxID=1458 RepID=A0ABU6NUU0_9BACI|nr:anti-repressor SinI family protein [Metabacillus fastidiosus]MEC2075389.1 anti-repressor SinI family protein [Metabacillus fastidiosus]MED4400905.1 anti-repressor SinI family protein [Metabacillus fastidiosus]MED4453518.1 anti-repressor SinI family protein [Metabacillus fastidiosus]MED4463831.1 anti-repressor SinI family protein [Metabacillus fastidiosus]MED4530687.1 anti-repressor SinI family protein [Metabacillus fastidiosus]